MVSVINDYHAFLEILYRNNISNNAYLSYEYYSVLCKYYPPKDFLCFIYENHGRVIGILPLVKRKVDYVILGYRFSNYLGYICSSEDDEEVDAAITAYIRKEYQNIVITFYDINTREKLFMLLDEDSMSKRVFLYNCPFCDVQDNFDVVFKRQITKAKKRTELKKFDRKLNNLGNIQIYDIDSLEKWNLYKQYFEGIFKVHEDRFSNVYIPKDLCLHKNREYYSELFESLVAKGKAYISIMTLDKVVISFVYSAVYDGIIMDWMPAFDPAFSKYNLGTVHLMHVIEYACGSPIYKQFDFSKGDGAYKARWSNGNTASYMFVRRYSSKLWALVKQGIVYIPFLIKGRMREKGILKYIKVILGKANKKHSDSKTSITIVDSFNNVSNALSYADIVNFDVDDRKLILDAIYNGDNIFIDKNESDIHVCKLVKENGNERKNADVST